MRRLLPEPVASVTVAEAYGEPRTRTGGRPTVGMCMVSSIDGSTVVDGRSTALSSPSDRDVLLGLRAAADVVLVGAETVRREGYGPPSKAGLRVGVVSRSGRVDVTAPLFASGAGFLVLPEDAPQVPVPSVRAGRGTVDLARALTMIDGTFVQLEGGARLNAAMLEADVVDEINLTVSPMAAGGSGPRLAHGAPDLDRRFVLAQVCEDDGFLFLRYRRAERPRVS